MQTGFGSMLAHEDGAAIARLILEIDEPNLVELVHELRQRRELSATVRVLNTLASNPGDGFLCRRAMQRIGLERGG
jgi:hypothetical protein